MVNLVFSEKLQFVLVTHKILKGCISLANYWAFFGKCVNVCHADVTFAIVQCHLKHIKNTSGKNSIIYFYARPGRCVHKNSQTFLSNA